MDKEYITWHNVKGVQSYAVTARSKADAVRKTKALRSGEQDEVIAIDFQVTDVFLSTTQARENRLNPTAEPQTTPEKPDAEGS